jgi:hypothetical protein
MGHREHYTLFGGSPQLDFNINRPYSLGLGAAVWSAGGWKICLGNRRHGNTGEKQGDGKPK